MAAITETTIAKYEAKGFRRWTKGNLDRLYINAKDYGVTFTRYSSGKVSGGEFLGEEFGAYEARNFEGTKVYIDVTTGELHVQTRTDYEDEICAAVEAIIAEDEDEDEADVEPAIAAKREQLCEEVRGYVTKAAAEVNASKRMSDATRRANLGLLDELQDLAIERIMAMSKGNIIATASALPIAKAAGREVMAAHRK